MDIPGLSMAMSQINLQSDVGVAMLSKSLDVSKQMGDQLTSMVDSAAMERSVTPYIGGNIDFAV